MASSNLPATRAVRPASSSRAGSGRSRAPGSSGTSSSHRPSVIGPGAGTTAAGGSRLDSGRRGAGGGLDHLALAGRLGRPIEQRRCGRWRLVGIGRPGRRARHPGEDRVDRAGRVGHRSRGKATRLARAAERRRRLGRDEQGDRVLLVATQRHRGRLAGAGQVARPPADLGQVDQPDACRAGPSPASVSSSVRASASEPSRRWAWAQDQLDAPAGRRVGPGQGRGHAGNRRRASSPRR